MFQITGSTAEDECSEDGSKERDEEEEEGVLVGDADMITIAMSGR